MKSNILIIAVVIITGIIVFNSLETEPTVVIERDTISTIDTFTLVDTLTVYKAIAYIDTLRDTLYLGQPIITAHIDTTIDSSRLQISYTFPPINEFNIIAEIKERIITKIEKIKELKTVTVTKPFYTNAWFFATIAEFILLILVL